MTEREREMLATVTQTLIDVITYGRESIDLDRLVELGNITTELSNE